MSSTIEKQLQDVKQLIANGRFQEASKLIKAGLKKKNIKKIEELNFFVLKSEILNDLGKHEDALKLSDIVLNESEKINDNLLKAGALAEKAIALFLSDGRQYSEALSTSDQGLELLKTLPPDVPSKVIADRKVSLLAWKGFNVQLYLGDFKTSIELYQEGLSIAEENGNKHYMIRILLLLHSAYLRINKTKKAEEYIIKAKKVLEEHDNKLDWVIYYFSYADYLAFIKMEYDHAIRFKRKALDLLKEIDSTLMIAGIYHQLGIIYQYMFQLDNALESYKEAMKSGDWVSHYNLSYIAYIYYLKYDLKKAQKYYLKNLEICEEIGEKYILSRNLYNLIIISIELNDFNQAKKYLEQLKQISKEIPIDRINRMYQFALISILKETGDIKNLVKSIELLNSFLARDDLPSLWRLRALYSLVEIRIKELQISPEKETLDKVKKQVIGLVEEALEKQYFQLLINAYRLESQLDLVELDVKKAIETLDKAQMIADNIDIELLHNALREDREKIEQKLFMWTELQESKAPISETVKFVSLESTAKHIKKETVIEEKDKKTGKIIEYRKLFALKI